MGFGAADEGEWKFWKYVEEAEFGPGPPVHTVFIVGSTAANQNSQGFSSALCYSRFQF